MQSKLTLVYGDHGYTCLRRPLPIGAPSSGSGKSVEAVEWLKLSGIANCEAGSWLQEPNLQFQEKNVPSNLMKGLVTFMTSNKGTFGCQS